MLVILISRDMSTIKKLIDTFDSFIRIHFTGQQIFMSGISHIMLPLYNRGVSPDIFLEMVLFWFT